MTTSTAPILAASEAAANGIAIDDAIASYRRNLRAENKSPNTIHTYLAALEAFNAYLKRTRGSSTGSTPVPAALVTPLVGEPVGGE